MKTFLPPKEKMRRISSDSDAESESPEIQPSGTLFYEYAPEEKRRSNKAALLSLFPGLGQLFNGEIAKGALFLSISLANLGLVVACLFSTPAVQALTNVAVSLKRQPNWDLAKPFASTVGSPALIIYFVLLAAFVAYAMREAHDRSLAISRAGRKMPRAAFTLPEATSGSYLAHLAVLLIGVISVLFFITPQPPRPQITDIILVPPEAPPPPKPPAPKQQPKQEQPKPVEKPIPKPVVPPKVAPPKPTPVAVAVKTDEPTPLTSDTSAPVPEAQPAAPAAPSTGDGGGAGGGGDGDAEIDMGPYMAELQRRIKKAWFPPKGNETKRVVVSFHIKKNGEIRLLKLERSSGVSVADDAALTAVENASPFAQLPAGSGDEIDIKFTFDYNVFGGGGRTPHQW